MIVVTGATGNVGRPLVRSLVAAGERVRAVARTEAEMPAGVEFHQADIADPRRLAAAVDGAESLFLLTAESFLEHGDMHAAMEAVKAAGLRRVVLLSSQGVATGRHPVALEAVVKASGLEWTMVQPGNFASNSFQWAESIRLRRSVTAPFADTALPAVDPADIADVAAAALREEGHVGRSYIVTGPEPITPRRQVAAIADLLGEPVAFTEETPAEARERMRAFMPAPVVEATLGILGTPSAEEQAVSPDVEHVLGRPARPYAEWAARNLAAFK
ncbi:NAD(P)H-binding protein [Glycomyces paridis]|uniref:NAD-dependent epimerase/dehydratase family protein n=1 Tax=Glycomyces paridis TaxID=2126555 RepID=A0A4S8PEF0_9ACTN|nr:NAD(P)H-binding protein [Glycomyces paridis]THV28758.1 NAD-dependent epimerase/dehydratase family protein [Glycomyces paridis]